MKPEMRERMAHRFHPFHPLGSRTQQLHDLRIVRRIQFRKAPQTAPYSRGRPFLEQHPGSDAPDQPGYRAFRYLPHRSCPRQFSCSTLAERHTRRGYRACTAAWSSTRAEHCTQIHQALGVTLDSGCGKQRLRNRPQALLYLAVSGKSSDPEHTRQHALHVAVENRRPTSVRERRDRGGGRATDARQLGQGLRCVGKTSAVLRDDLARRTQQITRARIVAKTCPVTQHVLFGRRRERLERRERFQESEVILNHRSDLSLLQHYFRQPDPVRVPRPLPGQVIASVAHLPANQTTRKLRHHRFPRRAD